LVLKAKLATTSEVRFSSIELLEENSWKCKGTIEVMIGHVHEFKYAFEARLQLHTPGYILRVEEFSGPADGKKLFEAYLDSTRSGMPNSMLLAEALAKVNSGR
jgi:hypothetical protein